MTRKNKHRLTSTVEVWSKPTFGDLSPGSPLEKAVVKEVTKELKLTVLQGLKKWMRQHNVSVVDLNWDMLKKHNISMVKLLRWEMHGKGARK